MPGSRRAHITLHGVFGSAFVITASLLVALGATGGTYAYLNSSAPVAGATLKAGTVALNLTGSPISLNGLYPSATKYAAVTVTNTGNTALALRVDGLTRTSASSSFATSLTVGVGVAASVPACTNGATAAGWSGTFASAPAGELGATIAPGNSAFICVSTTMATGTASSAQSLTAAYTVTLGGRQP